MSSEIRTTRGYELKRRAERQDETRQRIVEAAAELHSTVGPARTTIAAIAERAGVTRPTVYAHFPDGDALFRACSAHVRETVPAPDPTPWRSIADPTERLRTALEAMYAFQEPLEQLLDNVLRDAPLLPILRELEGERARYLEDVADVLAEGWTAHGRGRARVRRALGHALDFRTWQSLRARGCSRHEAIELMSAMVAAAASTPR